GGQGPAPMSAGIDSMLALGVTEVPGTGLLAACVPGAFGGWMTLLRDHGTRELDDVMQFAAGYAESGYPLVPRIADTIRAVEDLFRMQWPASARVDLPEGVPAGWSRFATPDLA